MSKLNFEANIAALRQRLSARVEQTIEKAVTTLVETTLNNIDAETTRALESIDSSISADVESVVTETFPAEVALTPALPVKAEVEPIKVGLPPDPSLIPIDAMLKHVNA